MMDDILYHWFRVLYQENGDQDRLITSLKKKLAISEQENTRFIMKIHELEGSIVPLIKEN